MGETLSSATNDILGDELDDIKGKLSEVTKGVQEKVDNTGLKEKVSDLTGVDFFKSTEVVETGFKKDGMLNEDDIPDAIIIQPQMQSPEPVVEQPSQFDAYGKQIEQVKKLKDLMDLGIISEEEFEAKKKEVLGL